MFSVFLLGLAVAANVPDGTFFWKSWNGTGFEEWDAVKNIYFNKGIISNGFGKKFNETEVISFYGEYYDGLPEISQYGLPAYGVRFFTDNTFNNFSPSKECLSVSEKDTRLKLKFLGSSYTLVDLVPKSYVLLGKEIYYNSTLKKGQSFKIPGTNKVLLVNNTLNGKATFVQTTSNAPLAPKGVFTVNSGEYTYLVIDNKNTVILKVWRVSNGNVRLSILNSELGLMQASSLDAIENDWKANLEWFDVGKFPLTKSYLCAISVYSTGSSKVMDGNTTFDIMNNPKAFTITYEPNSDKFGLKQLIVK